MSERRDPDEQHRIEWIAHRAGNAVELVGPALEIADAVELDVHLFRGRLEVRHGKVLWPFARLWERWELLPTDEPRPELDEVLAVAPVDAHLWFDLKGYTPRLTRRVLAATAMRSRSTFSCRTWWALWPARGRGGSRVMRSVGSRWQRWLVVRLRFRGADDGIVVNETLLDPPTAQRMLARTRTVIAWGVTQPDRARELIGMGVTGLIVDDLTLRDQVEPEI